MPYFEALVPACVGRVAYMLYGIRKGRTAWVVLLNGVKMR